MRTSSRNLHVTHARLVDVAGQIELNGEYTADQLDVALAENGVLRLDAGLPPGEHIAIIEHYEDGDGSASPQRKMAAALIRAILYIMHADGMPDRSDIIAAVETMQAHVTLEESNLKLVAAAAAYYAERAPEKPASPARLGLRLPTFEAVADMYYQACVGEGYVSDVAIERAAEMLALGKAGEMALLTRIGVKTPLKRSIRHDPKEYEDMGVPPSYARLFSWLRTNRNTDVLGYEAYARSCGLDPYEAAADIHKWLSHAQNGRPSLS